MLSEEQIKHLKSENDLLQLQLEDVNYMIGLREEELEILRAKAKHAVMLQSQLESTFDELGQMQQFIGKQQQQAEGASRREAAMEDEIIQSINIEKEYYTVRDRFASATAALNDINTELTDAANIYKELAKANSRIAELESSIDIATEEKKLLKYELQKEREKNETLQKDMNEE